MLLVRVYRYGYRPLHAYVRNTIHRVVAGSAAPANKDARIGWPEALELVICESRGCTWLAHGPPSWRITYRHVLASTPNGCRQSISWPS